MDNVTIIGIVTLIGALAGTVVPYLLKVWKDPELSFDVNYAYSLVLTVAVQVIFLIPDDVPTVTLKAIITAFASGFGLQSIVNKVVPKSGV